MATNMYDKSKSSKPTTYIERLKMEAEQRKKQAVMDKAAAADKAAKAKAAAAEDKKRTEFNARKSGTLPKFAAAKEVARTVRNEAQAKAKAIRDESNARTKAESIAKFGAKMDRAVVSAKAPTKAAAVPAKASSAAPAKSKINPLGRKLDKNGAPIIGKAELEKSGLSLRDFLNRERKLTPRDEPLQKLKEINVLTGKEKEQMSKGGMAKKKK
tara:strand:+ start:147 stop:785 length:639 start_codon:yes stop_codon:yes gene_type:complete